MAEFQLVPWPRQLCGDDAEVLAEVLHDGINLAIWQRELNPELAGFAAALLARGTPLADSLSIELGDDDGDEPELSGLAGECAELPGYAAFVADVAWLVRAYACLLEARRVGVRLRVLDKAMCPRFHVDRVPLRLVTTYAGPGSQWLAEGDLPRHRLADPSCAPDEVAVRSMEPGHVALLKGERWEGNEHTAIVHRSAGERRLLLTLDWLE